MAKQKQTRLATGVSGLDEILHGGFPARRAFLVRGEAGTGKTTLGLHFLTQGATNGESVLFISLSDTEEEIRADAAEVGFDLKGVTILDLSPSAEFFSKGRQYDIFSPAEEERDPITQRIVQTIDSLEPKRVFVDAITQLRYLSSNPFQFRRQIFSFLRFLMERDVTVLIASEYSDMDPDADLQFIADGIVDVRRSSQGRSVEVVKFHGSDYEEGVHSMRLTGAGMVVYPRLIPEASGRGVAMDTLPFGLPEMDRMLGGGITRGTVTIISGPSGSGKTSLGLQFMREAAFRGERSVVYSFEEELATIVRRSEGIGIPIEEMMDRGKLSVVPVVPLTLLVDEFSAMVRREVEEKGATTVMIDSISGYQLALRGENLVAHIYALCRYLSNMGVTTLLINEVEAITGEFRATEVGVSYLADNLVFIRYIELNGEIRKAMGVLKKRVTDFEKSLREMKITGEGIKVGRPLTGLRGILRGIPEVISGKPAGREQAA